MPSRRASVSAPISSSHTDTHTPHKFPPPTLVLCCGGLSLNGRGNFRPILQLSRRVKSLKSPSICCEPHGLILSRRRLSFCEFWSEFLVEFTFRVIHILSKICAIHLSHLTMWMLFYWNWVVVEGVDSYWSQVFCYGVAYVCLYIYFFLIELWEGMI